MELQQFLGRPPGSGSLPGQDYLKNRLVSKLAASRNVVITAHRGWGKQMLLKEVGYNLLELQKEIRLFYFDMNLWDIPSSFLTRYARELCISTSTKLPDKLRSGTPDYKLLDLAETIASRKKILLVIFISNFQYARQFENYHQVLRKFMLCWRIHKSCTYCISGHNHFIFKQLFELQGSPLQGFGKLYFLLRGPSINYIPHIRGLFLNGNKTIDTSAARSISVKTDNHLFYLQLLSWHSFLRTPQTCTVSMVEEAFEHLVYQYTLHIENILKNLTRKQLNYLRALSTPVDKICSRESLENFKLGSSGNVARIKESLEIKGIIEIKPNYISIIDPILSYWINKHFS
jgi:hypothetical protein